MKIQLGEHTYKDDRILVKRYRHSGRLGQENLTHEGLEKTLIKGCDVLEQLGIKYWLSSATLMGLNRDNHFIPNDKDVDIDIWTDKDIYSIVKTLPFDTVVRVVSSNNFYMQFAFFDEETRAIFDLFFFYPEGDRLVNRNDYGVFWYPREKFDILTFIEYNGRKYPSPDPDWYSEFMYGKDWRIPKSYKGHWTEDYIKDCSGFIFTGNENVKQVNYY